VTLLQAQPFLHFSRRLDVIGWGLDVLPV